MKYLLILAFIIFLDSCGGGGSSKKNNFTITIIDGYLKDSNVSIYDKDNKEPMATKATNSNGSFTYTDVENDLIYLKAISGIDTMSDEVFDSILYGIAKKGTSTIVSPLSTIVWAYNKNDIESVYQERAKYIQDKLGLEKDILSFDPIANISNEESSKIIKFNLTLEAISRLINVSLGGNFEYVFYSSVYDALEKNKNMDFLFSDAFIDVLSSKLDTNYNYLNVAIFDLKLRYLQKSIAYIVDEISYLSTNNKETLKRNYKASYILTYPIIKEASLLQAITPISTDDTSKYFNDINSKINSLNMDEILQGIKMIGGFRGILYKINDIQRDIDIIKPSFFAESFLNKEILLKSSLLYDKLSKSISSGAISQDDFKDNIIKNAIFLNIENQDILDSKIIQQIQDTISLSFQCVNHNAINPNAETFIRKTEILINKESFAKDIDKLRDNIKQSEDNAFVTARLDTATLDAHNAESLVFAKKYILKTSELQNININKKDKISQLVSATTDKKIIEASLSLQLATLQETLLKEEINELKLSTKITNYKTKISVIGDEYTKTKNELQENLNKEESLQAISKSQITIISNQEIAQKTKSDSISQSLQDTSTEPEESLVQEHTEIKNKETIQRNIIIQTIKAKDIYDDKLKAISNNIKNQVIEYEKNLNILSNSLTKGETPDVNITNTLQLQIENINSLESSIKVIKVTKSELASEIDFTINNLKSCYNKDDSYLFSIKPDQNNSFIKTTVGNAPTNTIFSNNALERKKSDGINSFYMPLGDYNVSILVSNTDTDKDKLKAVSFEVKSDCGNNTSFAFKAPLQIPNIPNVSAPELNTSDDIPNPNGDTNPPSLGDINQPPKDN